MNRRAFLRMAGLFSTAIFVQWFPLQPAASRPVEVQAQGVTYRGTSDGDIYTSSDAGKTWQLHTRFGQQCAVLDLFQDAAQQVYARLGYAGHSFDLVLRNNGRWKTV